jgi:hypothetical protein
MALWLGWWSRSRSPSTRIRTRRFGVFVSGLGLVRELMKGTRKWSQRSLELVLHRLRCLFVANCRRMLRVHSRWHR